MSTLTEKQTEIRKLIQLQSALAPDVTQTILKRHFSSVPRTVKILTNYHQFNRKKVLDIGSSYGQSLLYWGKDSEAVEIRPHMITFLRSLGRAVHSLNVEDGFSDIAPASFDAIFSNNLLEHLVGPHLFLARLHALLQKDGLLAIGHPLTPPTPFRQCWQLLGYKGWLQEEHVNFFTPQTSRLTLERAGFEVLHQYFTAFSGNQFLSQLTVPFGVHCLSVCRKIEGYAYDKMRLREFDPIWGSDLRELRP